MVGESIWYTRGIVYVWRLESNLEGVQVWKGRIELVSCTSRFPNWSRSLVQVKFVALHSHIRGYLYERGVSSHITFFGRDKL